MDKQLADTLDSLCELDEVLVTGTASSPHGLSVRSMVCTVATVSRNPDGAVSAVKVWPDDDIGEGKVWFEAAGIESIEVVTRDGEYEEVKA